MILVDTSIWSDHLRRGDAALERRLSAGLVLAHPFVIGELACGVFPSRYEVLAQMEEMPTAPVVSHREARSFIDRHRLAGTGVGYVDVHLLASAMLAGAQLWTRDRRLAKAASQLGLAFES